MSKSAAVDRVVQRVAITNALGSNSAPNALTMKLITDHGGIDVAEQMWGDHLADAVIAELRDWDLIDQLIDAAGPRCFGKGER